MLGNRTSVHRFIDGYRGPLWRKSQLNGAWKLRYFVLEKKKVRCFQDANCEKLVSELTLFNDTTLYDVPGISEGRSNLLYISASGTDDVYYLSSETEEEKYNWLESMTDAVHNGFKLINQTSLLMDPFYPSIDLCISYEKSTFHASNSNKLKPQNVENSPAVELRFGHNTSIYSLIMLDLDSVRADKDTHCAYLHWAIVNIEGTDIESGLEIASYESPAPEQNSGLHRYMFLLYDQASDFTPDQFELLDEMFAHRDKFSHLELMKQLHLGMPVGINGFYACWDAHCDVLHERMQYIPLPEYFSDLQAEQAETQRIEKARATLFHDFVLGDIFPFDASGFGESSAQGSIALLIEYDHEFVVEDGQSIAPSHTKAAPSVSYVPHPVVVDSQGNPACNMYTLILVDPDAPSRINHSMREHVKWVVLNIPGDSVEQGSAVLPYAAPAPAYASGLHRYVFALYKQKREFGAQELEDSREFFAKRAGIVSHEWVRDRSAVLVSLPVGVEAFLSEWDLSIDDIHKASGYMPPPQYRSPAQKHAMMAAEGGQRTGLFSPKSGGLKSTEVDDMQMRLRKIQEAQSRFNSQVTESSTRMTELEISRKTSRTDLTETSEERAGALSMEERDNDPPPEEKSTKKVAPRAPITLSSSAKAMNMSASQGLSVNIGESLTGGSSASASAAALLAANADDEPIIVSQQKETTSTSTTNVSTAQRSETLTSQVTSTSNVMDSTVYRAGEQVSQERSEQAAEQRNESREEKMEATHTQKVNATQSLTQSNGGSKGVPVSVPKLQLESQELHEANDRIQRAMIYDQQQQAAEKQRLELEAQEETRRVQKAEMLRLQQEVLERQKQEQQRAMEQQRLQAQQLAAFPPPQAQPQAQAQTQSYSPSPRAIPRKQRSRNEFFGGIPDSEYSDTDASAYDSASVFSGPPQQSRYNFLQSQNSNSGILPSISSQRSVDESEEFSDTSSSFMAPRPPTMDASPIVSKRPTSKSGIPPVDPVTRYKLIMEGIMQAKTTAQLCELFGVTTQTIFAGEKMKKKLSNDFMFKDSYLWIVPRTRSLHWSKGKLDAADSKYLLLDPLNGADPTAPPKGEMKGIVKRVRVSGPNLLITIESGDFLELKLSADGSPPAVNRAADWASVIKAYSQS